MNNDYTNENAFIIFLSQQFGRCYPYQVYGIHLSGLTMFRSSSKSFLVGLALITFASTIAQSQEPAGVGPEQNGARKPTANRENTAKFLNLRKARLAESLGISQAEFRSRSNTIALAGILNIPVIRLGENGKFQELAEFREGAPIYRTSFSSLDSARSIKAHQLWSGGELGLNLSGSTVTVGIWDDGLPRLTHVELINRVTDADIATNRTSTHATSIAGAIASTGVWAPARGSAFATILRAYDWNSDISEMTQAAVVGLLLSNHSYGTVNGWDFNSAENTWYWYGNPSISPRAEYRFGLYDATAKSHDDLAYNAPFYTIVRAAGNDRLEGPTTQPVTHKIWNGTAWINSTVIRDRDGDTTGFDTLDATSTAKNVLTVGSVSSGDGGVAPHTLSAFSGSGPTDDGRLKPDVVADGENVASGSDTANDGYLFSSGTSIATGTVTGATALLIERWRQIYQSQDPLSSMIKTIINHTASDLGNPGPDFNFGWGLMDTAAAANQVARGSNNPLANREDTIVSGETNDLVVRVKTAGTARVTIGWTDPMGPLAGNQLNIRFKRLLNDLDLRVIAGPITFQPWTLNVNAPSANAVAGDNSLDNTEQVVIPNASPGLYTIRVSHKGTDLVDGAQVYSLVTSGFVPSVEVSSLAFTPAEIRGGLSVEGRVTLSEPAPPGGLEVQLASANLLVEVPNSVFVEESQTSAVFSVDTNPAVIQTSVNVTATFAGFETIAPLIIRPSTVVSGLSFARTTLEGATTVLGTVTLGNSAPIGGSLVALSSNAGNIVVPATVAVAEGATTATFTTTTTDPSATVDAVVTASLGGTVSANLRLLPMLRVVSLAPNPTQLFSGQTSQVTIRLNRAVFGDAATIFVSSNNATVTVPASISIPVNSDSGIANAVAGTISGNATATITGSVNSISANATISLSPLPQLTSVTLASPDVLSGGTVRGTVTLNGPAVAGGMVVSLSDNLSETTMPSSVTLAAGASSAQFDITTTESSVTRDGTITASMNSVSRTVALRLLRLPLLNSFSILPIEALPGDFVQATLTIDVPAPAGGISVAISSTPIGALNHASSVRIEAGQSQILIPCEISPMAVPLSTITASASYRGTVLNAPLTVKQPRYNLSGTITNGLVPAVNVTVRLTQGGVERFSMPTNTNGVFAFPMIPSGTYVVTPSDPMLVFDPPSIEVNLSRHTGGIDFRTRVLSPITANTVPSSARVGTTAVGRLTIATPAPAGGAPVALVSSSPNVTVPAVVIVPQGARSANYNIVVSTAGTGTVRIDATRGVTKTASLRLVPLLLSDLRLNRSSVVGGNNVTGTLRLTTSAPAGGITVNLSMEGVGANAPTTVLIPAGATSATFTITTNVISSATNITVRGTLNSSTKSRVFRITVAP